MIFKLSLSAISLKLLLIGIVFNCFFFLVTTGFNLIVYFISFILIVGLEIFIFFMKPFLYKIVIIENSIYFYYRKLLVNSYCKEINQNELSFSYKLEIGARGIESYELRFYKNEKKIVGIGRGFDGWTQETLDNIIEEFENLNINKIE